MIETDGLPNAPTIPTKSPTATLPIGSTPDVLMPDVDFAYDDVPNLHDLLDELRHHGPVVPVRYHGQRTWLINGFDELERAFSDEVHFQSKATYMIHGEPSMGLTMQTMAGEEHRINRGLVSRAFFPRAIRGLVESLIEPIANELLDAIADREDDEIDLIPAYCRPFPFRVITRLFGIPVTDEPRLLEWALKLIDYPWDPDGAMRARHDFAAYLKPHLDHRRADPGEDLLSMLATAEFEGQRLSDEEIYSFARMIYPAGSDTAYKMLSTLSYVLLTNSSLREMSQAGDEQRAAIVEEGLRWEAPVALLPRICSKDILLGGSDIRQGDWTLFGITAANNDPSVFDEPRRFDPSRKQKNLAFGQGVHFCLGVHLARRELETAMKLAFERFPSMVLSRDTPVEIVGGVLRGPRELWVRPRG